MTPTVLVICGPTASGKSDLALRLAEKLGAEIINADSMQVYRGMDIGTAKPSAEERTRIPHHLIDIADPDQPFSAADFAGAADAVITDITARGKRVIVAGGTGLYIRALLNGLVDSPGCAVEFRQELHEEAGKSGKPALLERLRQVDPELAARMHPNNLLRIIRALEVHHLTGIPLSQQQQDHSFSERRYTYLQVGLQIDRTTLYQRIDERVDRMLSDGLLDEVRGLLTEGYSREAKAMRSIGYKEAGAFLSGEYTLEEARRLMQRNTRHYAKRQLTWFKADRDILWLEYPAEFDTILKHAIEFFDPREA
jgi:tRNA dimethylallyltransferase